MERDRRTHRARAIGVTVGFAIAAAAGAVAAPAALAQAGTTNLRLVMTDSPDPVIAGQDITYTLDVRNGGPAPATGVKVTYVVPAGVTFKAAGTSNQCMNASGTVTCDFGMFADGETKTRTVVVTTTGSENTINSSATVAGNQVDPNTGNNSSTANTTVTPRADVAITKTATESVTVGENINYNLRVVNNGPSRATNVVATDVLPAGVTFSSTGTSSQCTNASGTVTCEFGNLDKDQDRSRTIAVTANTAGTVTNTATVDATQVDPNAANDSSTDSTTVTQADLAITKTDSPDPVFAGEDITYTLSVKNNGLSRATGVTATDVLPAGVTFKAAGTSNQCTNASGTVTCNFGGLDDEETKTRTIVVTATGSQSSVSNTATVAGDQHDPNTANNSDSETTTVTPSADLAITKTDDPDPVVALEDLSYKLSVTNNGPSDATGVKATDVLPSGVTFKSAGTSSGCTNSSGTVTCDYGAIASGQTEDLTIVVVPSSEGQISNTATVDGDQRDPDATDDSSTASTTVLPPSSDLVMTKTDSPDPVAAGSVITYTLSVKNNGPSDATGVTAIDNLPPGTTFRAQGTSPECTLVKRRITCEFGSIADGDTVQRTIKIRVSTDGRVRNTATVEGDQDDPDTSNNSSTAVTRVDGKL